MHRIDRSLLVPYGSAQMFALVRDVVAYPQFLPWCPSTAVHPQQEPDIVEARVDIAYLGVRSHFTTRNAHYYPDSIELTLVDGPFRDLHGHWRFLSLGDAGCKVTLVLQYRFAAGMLGRVIAPVFEKVANSLVDAFASRAERLYEEPGGAR